jgi:hypothetical protein
MPFGVPFKVPFSSAASTAELRVASNSNLVFGDTISNAPKTSHVSPMERLMEVPIQSQNDDVEVLSGC